MTKQTTAYDPETVATMIAVLDQAIAALPADQRGQERKTLIASRLHLKTRIFALAVALLAAIPASAATLTQVSTEITPEAVAFHIGWDVAPDMVTTDSVGRPADQFRVDIMPFNPYFPSGQTVGLPGMTDHTAYIAINPAIAEAVKAAIVDCRARSHQLWKRNGGATRGDTHGNLS
jgi:hypothetical protein